MVLTLVKMPPPPNRVHHFSMPPSEFNFPLVDFSTMSEKICASSESEDLLNARLGQYHVLCEGPGESLQGKEVEGRGYIGPPHQTRLDRMEGDNEGCLHIK